MRSIRMLGWLLLSLPLVCAAGSDPYLLTVDSSAQTAKRAPEGYVPISLNEDAAIRAAVSGRGLWIPLPNGSRVHLDYRGKIMHPDGTWTFIGSASGASDLPKTLITFGDHSAFGDIYVVPGQPFILTTWRGRAWLVDSRARPHARGLHSKALIPHGQPMAASSIMAGSSSTETEATPNNVATIDLLVVYTTGFRQTFGSTAAAIARIDHVVDLVNQSFLDSGVYAHVRLVHAEEVAYPDNTDSGSALEDLQGRSAAGTPQSLSSVASIRAQYGADVVSMMRAFDADTQDCGTSVLIGYNLAPITSADAWKAFSVVDDEGAGEDCSGLAGYQLADELGSNFGLVSQNSSGRVPGAYPFSYAYQKSTPTGPFLTEGTLEADSYPGYAWPYFSNPNISLCDGPCGISDQSDAARSLNLTLPIIAAFEPTRLPMQKDIAAKDVDGDGMSDLLFQDSTDHQLNYWLMIGDTPVHSSSIGGVGAGYTVAATGDFNGDGKVDVVWTSSRADLYMWTGNGESFVSKRFGGYPTGWEVVGAGDVNGDGKDDLLLYNASRHLFGYWLMNGTQVLKMQSIGPVGTGYWVAGVGDFNGDGKADVVWTSNNDDLYMWMGNGTGFASSKVGTYPAGWRVVGTGDVDGDGKSDLLFYNPSTHQFSYRIMSGTKQLRAALIGPVGIGYRVATTGDYNGDGKVDVVWTSSKNDLYMWTGNGSGFVSQYFDDYSAKWQVVSE